MWIFYQCGYSNQWMIVPTKFIDKCYSKCLAIHLCILKILNKLLINFVV